MNRVEAKIPVSVFVMTKNEQDNLPYSLPPLVEFFDEVLIVDSKSTDHTQKIVKSFDIPVHCFEWNEHYPKKKQYCLDTIPTQNEWVFLCDADEIVTPQFVDALKNCNFNADGYFVRSDMVWRGKHLRFGQKNAKLCLHKKKAFYYPVIDDLNISGGWEVEGHYQPIPTDKTSTIKTISAPILHHDRKQNAWKHRHKDYALWEAEMTLCDLWPSDPVRYRQVIKSILRQSRLRPFVTFLWGYMIKFGFLDGWAGFDYAFERAKYTQNIQRLMHEYQNKA